MSGLDVVATWLMVAGILLVKLIPIVLVGGIGYYFFKRSEMGRALTHRDETSGEVVLLRQEVDDLRSELAEMQERLDFSERALAALERPVRQRVELPKHPTPPEPVHG